jgi:hypothetical protein
MLINNKFNFCTSTAFCEKLAVCGLYWVPRQVPAPQALRCFTNLKTKTVLKCRHFKFNKFCLPERIDGWVRLNKQPRPAVFHLKVYFKIYKITIIFFVYTITSKYNVFVSVSKSSAPASTKNPSFT